MLPSVEALRALLRQAVSDRDAQGHDVEGLADELAALPPSYDALVAFAERLNERPLRADWPYVEPDDLDGIWAAADPARPQGTLDTVDPEALGARAEAAFLASVCGCMLGKPFEFDPTLEEIRDVLEPLGEWPLRDYLPEAAVANLREVQAQMPELIRERVDHVAYDDDINYTVIGMVLLERYGISFTREQLLEEWTLQLPVRATFGPERTALLETGIASLTPEIPRGARLLNPGEELCGALIRVDAYGYGCFGRPALAAELAWRDAATTHRRTGVYAAMFVAAALASVPFCAEPLDPFRIALGFVPRRSRFAERAADALRTVEAADGWLDAYRVLHMRFGEYGHCRIYQEIGTLMNTLRFAPSAGEGICIQVMQGNDTDSFGATAGSLLGARFGTIERRWTAPFRDDLRAALATFPERSLEAVAARMRALPGRVAAALETS